MREDYEGSGVMETRVEILKIKMPCGMDLLAAVLNAVCANPPRGFDRGEIKVGDTDKDGYTPVFGKKDDGLEGAST